MKIGINTPQIGPLSQKILRLSSDYIQLSATIYIRAMRPLFACILLLAMMAVLCKAASKSSPSSNEDDTKTSDEPGSDEPGSDDTKTSDEPGSDDTKTSDEPGNDSKGSDDPKAKFDKRLKRIEGMILYEFGKTLIHIILHITERS
ncbi:hypothetical protein TNCT_689931 [Trichonephila clavata]|uniref:Uncharacterized protein n=1 Tax=Trichonephila clavata TaxID=2740835 RepID=A0A8X6FF34_TRICU|nr:hypothetical protein TNCT_689931 [Trichonephila clavata]